MLPSDVLALNNNLIQACVTVAWHPFENILIEAHAILWAFSN
jgi:hypothetical protein